MTVRVINVLWLAILVSLPVLAADVPTAENFTNSVGMEFVRVEPGTFMMGFGQEVLSKEVITREGQLVDGDFDEHPAHQVEITKPFYIGTYEVTNTQYELFDPKHRELRGKKGVSKEDNEAVVHVNWYEARAFCGWLSDKEGLVYRLPTEAEWEYACRAGTTTAYHTGPVLPKEFFGKTTLTVGRTPPNRWGLYDMHGNVEEWCCDWYGPYEAGKQTDPVGRIWGDFRVTRGGSHSAEPYFLRSSNRLGTIAVDKHELIGFRVVLGEMPTTKPLPKARPERYQMGVSQEVPTNIREGPNPDRPYFHAPRKFIRMPQGDRGPLFNTHNHFISVVECPNGDLLAIWHTCITETGRELGIACSRLRFGNAQWERASVFWNAPDRNDHGHALWFDERETIYHFSGLASRVRDVALILRTSNDNGVTWSKARVIAEHGRSRMPIETVLRTQDGSIVLACDAGPASLWISRDEGLSWHKSEGHMRGLHNAVVELRDGRMMAFGRKGYIDGKMPISISADMGKTWEHSASEFHPIHYGQRPVVLRLKEGPLFFASFCKKMMIADAAGGQHEVSGLYGAISLDEGKTWPYRRLITDDGSGREIETMDANPVTMDAHNSEQVGYLTVCQTADRVIHLLSSRQHYAFNLKWLMMLAPAAPKYPVLPQAQRLPVKRELGEVFKPKELAEFDKAQWGISGAKPAAVMSIDSNGLLKVHTGDNQQFWLRSNADHGFAVVEQKKGFTAEIRTQILKSSAARRGVDLELYDGAGSRYVISIKDSGVYWYEGHILGSAFLSFEEYTPIVEGLDNTDTMHTYRLAVRADRVTQIYRDGKLVGVRRYEYRTPRKAYIQFGGGSGLEGLIDYVAFDLGGPVQP